MTSSETPLPPTSTSPPPEASSTDPTVNKKTKPLSGIVGGILGGLALIAALAGLFAIYKRSSARGKHVLGPLFAIDDEEPHRSPADPAAPQANEGGHGPPWATARLARMKDDQTSAVHRHAAEEPPTYEPN